MRNLIIVFILLTSMSFSYAQEQGTRLFLKAGASIPLGEFGSKRLTSTSHFANVGRSIGAKVLYPITKGFDLSAGISNNSYTIDRTSFDTYATRTIQADLRAAGIPITRQYQLTSSLKSYKNTNLSLGFKIDIKLQEKLKMYLTPSVSYSYFKTPQIGIIVRDSSYEFASSQDDETSWEVAFTISGGTIYTLSKELSLVADITLLNSNHKPEITASAVDGNGNRTSLTQVESIDFSAMTISLGVIIRLSKKE